MIDQMTEPAGAAPAPTSEKWSFVRATDAPIGGVCKSLAIATGLDVGLVRLAMIGSALWGPGLLAYVAVVLAMPKATSMDDPRLRPAPDETARVLRVLLGVGGALGVVSVIGGIGWADWPLGSFYRDGGAFGLTLIAVAIAVIVLRRRQQDGGGGSSTLGERQDAVTVDVPVASPVVDATPDDPTSQPTTTDRADDTTPFAVAPPPAAPISPTFDRPVPVVGPDVPGSDAGVTDAEVNRTALLLARITGWLIVLAAAVVALALFTAVRLGVLEVRVPGLVWPLGIAALGAACVVLVMARSIAIVSVALVGLVLAWGIGAIATQFAGPTGTRTVSVADPADLADRYEHAAGWLTLDLSALELDGRDATVEIDVRVGRADIVVSDDVAVDISSDVLAGVSTLLGQRSEGWNVDDRLRDAPPGSTGTLTIDLEVGAGTGRVCRVSEADDDRHCPS